MDEIRDRIHELTETITRYESEYEASSPADVDALAAVDDERSIDEVYADLGDWGDCSTGPATPRPGPPAARGDIRHGTGLPGPMWRFPDQLNRYRMSGHSSQAEIEIPTQPSAQPMDTARADHI